MTCKTRVTRSRDPRPSRPVRDGCFADIGEQPDRWTLKGQL